MKYLSSILAAASTLLATVSAQQAPVSFFPVDQQYVVRIGVPQSAASSGQGNVYFQVQAFSSYSWVGFGTGSRMSGSNMFLVYSDGSGNVTVSPRQGSGHQQPQAIQGVDITMLEGSGDDGNLMTANFMCGNCDQIFDFSGQNPFIAAWREGSPIASSSIGASLTQHNDYTTFDLDLSAGVIAADANPFVSASTANPNDPSSPNSPNGNTGGIAGGNTTGATAKKTSTVNLVLIHGIIMAVVWVFLYPVGAILMPLVGKWLVHAGWQMVAFMTMWVGFGIGYKKAQDGDILFQQGHTILGTVVCVGMIVQPVIGYLHHMYFKKHQTRGAVSHAHIWYGRIIMFLGILNGGIGLKLSNASNTFVIAYAVIAALTGVAYIASAYIGQVRRSRRVKESGYRPTYSPQAGTAQAYKPSGNIQYSPVQPTFGQQVQQPQYGGQQSYGRGDQTQPSQQQYGNYR